jgi:hypothetical protein
MPLANSRLTSSEGWSPPSPPEYEALMSASAIGAGSVVTGTTVAAAAAAGAVTADRSLEEVELLFDVAGREERRAAARDASMV